MNRMLDILIPRFITERVAADVIDGELHPICCVDDLAPGEPYDVIVTVRTLNLFGFGLFPRMVEDS